MTFAYSLRPAFTPLTIALMVIGFIVAWPLGLVMLAYMLWGDRIPEIRRHFEGMGASRAGEKAEKPFFYPAWNAHDAARTDSGNTAFDEYRAAELKRLDEERQRLENERREFESYVSNLRKARDKEEFDRFMNDRAHQGGNDTITL